MNILFSLSVVLHSQNQGLPELAAAVSQNPQADGPAVNRAGWVRAGQANEALAGAAPDHHGAAAEQTGSRCSRETLRKANM